MKLLALALLFVAGVEAGRLRFILSDKISCTVGFVNCLLESSHGKVGEFSEKSVYNLYVRSILLLSINKIDMTEAPNAPNARKQRQNCPSIKWASPSNSLISLSANFCPEGYVSVENDLNGVWNSQNIGEDDTKTEPTDRSRSLQQCAGVQFNRLLEF